MTMMTHVYRMAQSTDTAATDNVLKLFRHQLPRCWQSQQVRERSDQTVSAGQRRQKLAQQSVRLSMRLRTL